MIIKPLLPVVAGPTASGKTACAIALCRLAGQDNPPRMVITRLRLMGSDETGGFIPLENMV